MCFDLNLEKSQNVREDVETEKYVLTKVKHKNLVTIKLIVNMGDSTLLKHSDIPKKQFYSPDRVILIMKFSQIGDMRKYLLSLIGGD